MQHYFTGSLVSRDMNQKGYMYSQTNSAFHVITPKGEVTTHELGDNLRLAAFGDGFTVIEEHKSGFEAVEYVYHFYDDSGKELTTYSSGAKQIYELSHIGEGTFLLRDASCQNDSANAYGYSTQCAHLYFAKSNVWHKNVLLSYPGCATVNYSYQDGVFMIRGANINSSGNTHPGEFTYVNNQGEVQALTVPADYGTQPKYLSHDSGTMLFYDTYTKQVYCYDVKAKTWTGYQGKYTEQMYPENSVIGDGHVVLCLRGADNNYYSMILDKDMKDTLDSPVLGAPIATRDGFLYARTDNRTLLCYDLKGEKKSEIANVNTSSNWYDEGIICTNQLEFLKPDGTSAFDVSFSGAKQIILPK